jgi:hypothetical protein
MFNNNICEQSVFWRDSIYVFRRAKAGEKGFDNADTIDTRDCGGVSD